MDKILLLVEAVRYAGIVLLVLAGAMAWAKCRSTRRLR